ncbi:hypothetical protein CRE_26797 [Caenorhabditis remanei]|uniref:Uncharacterized protein n=1 Tax=Caenorhabditis remanei TaxID=31234 RepID=E3NGA9_CAERE|nr:hypothetical protein CRE_26797 [Caenorhabditis remanei]
MSFQSDGFDAICNDNTSKWRVRQQNSTFGKEQIFENQEWFSFACATSY